MLESQYSASMAPVKHLSFNLWAFIVLGVLFLANVMLGKARVLWGWDLPLLSDVWEFLLLLLVGLFFTLAALQRERQVGDRAAQRSR